MNRKKAIAVRLFGRAVKLSLRIASPDWLSKESGRTTDDLCRYQARLRELSERDPDKLFWTTLERANLKLLRYVARRTL
jgi:hypothetical protein